MTAYCCGTPVREDGTYYCPSCGYESKDIEKFAVGMCWKCLFPEPDKEEKVTIKSGDLRCGDKVRLTKEVVFNRVSPSGRGFYGTDGNFYCNHADLSGQLRTGYDVTVIERAAPENWPPQDGDVWGTESGAEYACLHQYGTSCLYRTDAGTGVLYLNELKRSGARLLYRRSNNKCETKTA